MATNDGGPAFAVPMVPYNDGFTDVLHSGMSLRDYFAAKAMQTTAYQQFAVAIVKAMGQNDQRVTLVVDAATTAREAYRIADAMLSAREVQP